MRAILILTFLTVYGVRGYLTGAKDAPKDAKDGKSGKLCWKQLAHNYVWLDTLSGPTGQVDRAMMGYFSGTYDEEYPATPLSGQPYINSAEDCQKLCDTLGPLNCAAAQYFDCGTPVESWCNLLTPYEYKKAKDAHPNGKVITPSEAEFKGGYGLYRAAC